MGFFYDPNIHPYSEYLLRLLDVKRSCKKLGIELLEGPYDFENWLESVRGLEREKEKGKRCEVCFEKRFLVSAKKALEIGENKITTTLLVSPLKSQEQLKRIGDLFYKEHGVEFIALDYRSGGGTQDQSRVTKEQKLYRQDYCGCIYGLTMQRADQNKLLDEMFSPISNRILPASIEERLKLYTKRIELEENDISYNIVKQKFLNYREFFLKVESKERGLIDAYALFYSTLPRKKTQGRVEVCINNIYHFNRDEVKFITLDFFNQQNNTKYSSIKELIYNPISVDDELNFREKINKTPYDLSPIIVVEEIVKSKLSIFLDAKVYEDTKEIINL